jgi:chorismate lyase / 3-hydroxybenzoate synthase
MQSAASIPVTDSVPHIDYRLLGPPESLPAQVLAAVTFGAASVMSADPRWVRVGLKVLAGQDLAEFWQARGAVTRGLFGAIRYCADEQFLAGAIELNERQFSNGLYGAAEATYRTLREFLQQSAHPYPLRIWNYFADINQGADDQERYKLFCSGRLAGIGESHTAPFPAATAIGRRDGSPVLQVYWLAGRSPGIALENPRQTSAFYYPRQYGPTSPSFSRAMLLSPELLLISGTASIVGHATHHPGNLAAQLDELLTNIDSVLQRAHALAPKLAPKLNADSKLKFYLRHASDLPLLQTLLQQRLPKNMPRLILEADICREDLLIEADCFQYASL